MIELAERTARLVEAIVQYGGARDRCLRRLPCSARPDALLTRLGAHAREGLSGCLIRLAPLGDTADLRRAVVELNEYERRLHSNRAGYVSDICVMPAYRGQRIAADLFLAIERHLAQSGISRMRLASPAANASAQTAYRRAGHTPYEIVFEKWIGDPSGVSPLNQSAPLRPHSIGDAGRRGTICREVIESLPDWFGIPAANEEFVAAAKELPMLACFALDGEVLGFVSVKARTAIATELYVLGVKRTWHRRGIGRSLIEAAAKLAALQGARFLTVKTLAPSNPDPNYATARRFYEAMGFLPIEEFPTLRTRENLCLLMLRPLGL